MTPQVRQYKGILIVQISKQAPEFAEWLNGQTMPVVEGASDPFDWAYYEDYIRWAQKRPVTD